MRERERERDLSSPELKISKNTVAERDERLRDHRELDKGEWESREIRLRDQREETSLYARPRDIGDLCVEWARGKWRKGKKLCVWSNE